MGKLLLLLVYYLTATLRCAVVVVAEVEIEKEIQCTVQEDGACTIAKDEQEACTDLNEVQCPLWEALGQCDTNPGYMLRFCKVSCKTCFKTDLELDAIIAYNLKCPLDRSAPTVLPEEGDLDKLFERIVADDSPESAAKHYSTNILSRDPWIVLLDDFLTQDECDLLIQWGHKQGFERSSVAADVLYEEGRTSASAWCYGAACLGATQRVIDKVTNLIDVPSAHYEWLQILQYKEGQFYGEHHDFDYQHLGQQCGPRVLTLFLYLNEVEEGGATNFNILNLTVKPKPGRAVLWPSVLNSDIWDRDNRTEHQALPVQKGIKYGANVWVHARDYKALAKNGCL